MIISAFLSLVMTSLVISLLILIFAFLSRAFPRMMSSLTRYVIWVLILISLLLPIRPLFGKGLFAVTPPHLPRQASSSVASSAQTTSSAGGFGLDLTLIKLICYGLLIIWLIGSIIYLSRHLLQYTKLRRLIQRVGVEITDPETLELFNNLRSYMGIKTDNIKLVTCHFIKTPMLTGFRHPMILLPDQDFSHQQLEIVLEHELTHYSHRDLFVNLLMLFATSLHWFNPVVRLANQVIQEEGEILCDEAVLRGKNLDYRRFYGKTILSLIESGEPKAVALSTCFFESKANLQHRLIAILDIHNPMKRLSYLTLLASLVLIALSGSVFVLATELEPTSQRQPAQNQKKEDKPAKTSESSSSSSQAEPSSPASDSPAPTAEPQTPAPSEHPGGQVENPPASSVPVTPSQQTPVAPEQTVPGTATDPGAYEDTDDDYGDADVDDDGAD